MGIYAMTEKSAMLKTRFGSTAPPSKPSTWYLALSTTEPFRNVSTGVIESITEFSGGGYARLAITNNDTEWTITDDLAVTDGTYTWTPSATVSGTQPNYWVLYDAITGGVACYSGTLTVPVSWVNGTVIDVSNITVSLPDA